MTRWMVSFSVLATVSDYSIALIAGTSLEQPGRIIVRFTFKEELKEELRCIRTEVRKRIMTIDSHRNVNFM